MSNQKQKDKVLELLQQINPFPKQDRDNIVNIPKGKTEQTYYANNSGFVLGKVRTWSPTKEGKTGIIDSKKNDTPKYKELYKEATKLMKLHNPNFKFTSIQFNKNQKTKKHTDSKNIGKSFIIGLGDYNGGDVRLYTKNGDSYKDIDIHNRFATFNGSELEHETRAFTGERYTLVFYSVT